MAKNKLLVQVGNRIRVIRKARGISQEQMAMDAGLDRAYYGRIERGEVNVAVLNLLKIAGALETEVGAFFPKSKR
jgi:transcriptional regulator with XRE-family HTH domain